MHRLLILSGIVSLFVLGCSDRGGEEASATLSGALSDPGCKELQLGHNHTPIGQVCLRSDGTDLRVVFTVDEGYELRELHAWVGTTDDYPANPNGKPVPGQFSQLPNGGKADNLPPGTHEYAIVIPLAAIGPTVTCDSFVYLLAHATVDGVGSGSAWAEGVEVANDISMLSSGNIVCDGDEEDPVICETAFAFGGPGIGICFSEYGIERWGWTNDLADLEPGDCLRMPLLAGAAHCNEDGFQVGVVCVSVDDGYLEVFYDLWGNFYLEETHLYVGGAPLPSKKKGGYTAAPGQFGNQHDLTGEYTSWDWYGLEAELPAYLAAHAVVCGTESDWEEEPADPCEPR
jgi:hypothetical protein